MRKFICIPLLLFILSCSGGKGTSVTLPGLSGTFCVGDDSYTIDEGQGEQKIPFEKETFLNNFLGNIGGQIRAVSDVFASIEDVEPVTMLLWGTGSSLRGGRVDSILGTVPLTHRGVITDLKNYGDPSAPSVLFGSQAGLGIIETFDDSGKAGFKEKKFKSIPSGVLSVSVVGSGSENHFYFSTGNGYILGATESDFRSDSKCYGIVASPSSVSSGGLDMYPAKAAIISSKAAILSKNSSAVNLSPTFAEAFDPILEGLVTDNSPYLVQVLDTNSKNLTAVAFPDTTEGFYGFDRFIPTDIATDGSYLYVAGLAYEKTSIDSLISSCTGGSEIAEKVSCLREKAKDGSLTSLDNASGLDAVKAAFFIYRDLERVAEYADYFAGVPLSVFMTIASSPALIFKMVVENDVALMRGPNFLSILEKSIDSSGKERWTIKHSVDGAKGLLGGVPAQVDLFTDSGNVYGATTTVGLKDGETKGSSALELITSEGAFYTLDGGAMINRMEDGSGSYVEAIELLSDLGGLLYLENISDRKYFDAYVSSAAYDGNSVAYASSDSSQWHISWQKADNDSSKGTYNISLTGSTFFRDFPDVGSDAALLKQTRKIVDLKLSQGKLFALLYGFYEGKHYYQAQVFGASLSDGVFQIKPQGTTDTVSINGSMENNRSRFQKITKNSDDSFTAIFSCASGLKKFTLTPSTSSPPTVSITNLFSVSDVIDLDLDEDTNQFAFITESSIRIRSLEAPTADISGFGIPMSQGYLTLDDASVTLKSQDLFIATPIGATYPFWIIDISDASSPELRSKCSACDFNGLAYFKAFSGQLLSSSDTGGIEIYDISNLD